MKNDKVVDAEGAGDTFTSAFIDAMKFCLMQKYAQSEAFRKELERSRGLFIEDVMIFSDLG